MEYGIENREAPIPPIVDPAIFAEHWDDRESVEANVERILWWLEHSGAAM